jgi:hypothetical protein
VSSDKQETQTHEITGEKSGGYQGVSRMRRTALLPRNTVAAVIHRTLLGTGDFALMLPVRWETQILAYFHFV